MGTSDKPTLGYPTRTEAVLALRRKGFSRASIALMIADSEGLENFTTSNVGGLEWAAVRRMSRTERRIYELDQIAISRHILDRLRDHADARELEVGEFVNLLLKAVVEGDLVAAVIDDGM